MGGSSSQTIGQRYFAKLTTFIGNPIEKLIGINFDNRGWIFKPDNGESFLRVESPNLYGDKEGGVAGFIDIHTGTADQLPNTTYSADFPKVSGYPFQSYLLFRGLGRGVSAGGVIGEIAGIIAKRHHYNKSFYHGNSGYMKEMLLWPQRIHVRNDGRPQWYDEKAEINPTVISSSLTSYYKYHVQDGFSSLNQLASYAAENFDDSGWGVGQSPFGYVGGSGLPQANTFVSPSRRRAIMIREKIIVTQPALVGNIKVEMRHDDGGVLYWNGEQIPLSVDSYFVSYAVIPTSKIKAGENTLFCAAVDSVPAGSPSGIYLYLKYESLNGSVKYADINPIHKIREIFTDDTAMNKPESDVNDVNFKKAADVLYTEKLGISWSVTEKSCLEAINELCGHIEAGVRMNRQTGLYEMVLFRDDWFAENEIHTLPVNKIKSMQLDGATSADELINKLNVSYYNRDAIKNSSFSVAENAAIRNLNGHENSDEVKFPYFMNQRNAAVVTQWKLKQMSTPVWQGTFTTGFYEARKWNRYDLLRLEWPRKWAGTILVRIMKINLGTGTDVSIDFVEVVPYSSDLSSSIVIDTPVDTSPKPPQPALFKAFELSYLEAVQLNGQKAVDDALTYNPDAGYAAVIAQRPQTNSLNALMYTDTGNDYERVGAIAYSETAELDQSISKTVTAFIVKQAGDIDMVSIGTQITINQEIMVYQAYDEETGLLTVKRGALDTIPQNHLSGSVLYFADDFITVDPTEYVTGEIINVKAQTTTPSGILDLDDTEAQQVEIKARANRPYPPANVKINGQYFPSDILGDLVLTWVHRNRLQQTTSEVLGWFDQGVTIEDGVEYIVELYDADDVLISSENVGAANITTVDYSTVTTPTCKVKLYSVRDGYVSSQAFEHEMILGFLPPHNILGTWNNTTQSVDLTWEFDE
ncbi:hypothetical protein ACNFX6_13830 [Acinetobacter johnsonii]|uniref:hypothetical protein n=1 Tax=Acinetobacter johnsonii TaxID=40214 RepID=UPI003CF8B3B1